MKKLLNLRGTKNTLAKDQRGLSTVEYLILLVLIAALAVGLWSKFGVMVTEKLEAASGTIDSELIAP